MRSQHLFLAFLMGLGLALLTLVALTGTQAQAAPEATCNRYVLNTDGADTGNCSNVNSPCRTVRYAVGQAASGNVICVADNPLQVGPSVYTGTIVITKSVTLDGAWQASCLHVGLCSFTPVACNPAGVLLDAQGTGRVISITGSIAPRIQCFTITGGNGGKVVGDPARNNGGGIYSQNAAPLILSNIITGNSGCISTTCSSTGRGGGIYLLNAGATAVISNNLIANNWADNTSAFGEGGGIYMQNSYAQVLSNTIQTNRAGTSAGNGGGICVIDGSPVVADNRILYNAAGTGVACNGGGVFVRSSTPVTLERNLVQFNRAFSGTSDPVLTSRGGGIYYDGAAAVIRDNTVSSNMATNRKAGLGGGMYLRNLSGSAVVSGNTVADDNQASYGSDGDGGGMYLDSCQATVTGNHLFLNTASSSGTGWGGGVYVNGGGGLLQGNTITSNVAMMGAVSGYGWGGGMAISNSLAVVQDNWIAWNAGTSAPNANGVGGGVAVLYGAPQILDNHILSNTANSGGGTTGTGGGFFLEEARPWLDGNTILDNRATGSIYSRGGGVRIAFCPAFTLTNNIIARNVVSSTGSGVAIIASTGQLAHNTIAENLAGDGVGVNAESSGSVTLTNNIIVSQSVGISRTSGTTVVAQYTLFEGNGSNYNAGVTNVNQVAGPAALRADYHLKNWSNAIDHATPLSWVTEDVDGDARPFGAGHDVGADEASCNRYVLNVDTTNVGRDCSDPTHPCRTVTYALGQALDGDRICIADHPLQPGPSVYTGTHVVNKSVTLDGAWQAMCVDPSDLTCSFWAVSCNPANVVLDAQGGGRVIQISSNLTPSVQCLSVTGGRASGDGGGIYASGAHPTVNQCLIYSNTATNYGGGIYVSGGSAARVTGSRVYSNSANHSGGIWVSVPGAMIENNLIYHNVVAYTGGGISIDHSDNAVLTGNQVVSNTANYYGGIAIYNSNNVRLVNTIVADNQLRPGGSGAGISVFASTAHLLHTTVARNRGGAGQGIYLYSDANARVWMTNTILVSHTVGIRVDSTNAATLTATLWGAGAWANGTPWAGAGTISTGAVNIWQAPGFVGPAGNDYHLAPGSLAIDAGIAAGVTSDIDGDPRPIGLAPDLGADERRMCVYLPLVMRNY